MDTKNQNAHLHKEIHVMSATKHSNDEGKEAEDALLAAKNIAITSAILSNEDVDSHFESQSQGVIAKENAVFSGELPSICLEPLAVSEEDATRALSVCNPCFVDGSVKELQWKKNVEANDRMEVENTESDSGSSCSVDKVLPASDNLELSDLNTGKTEALGFAHHLRGSTLMTRLSNSRKNDIDCEEIHSPTAMATADADVSESTLPLFSLDSCSNEKQNVISLVDPLQKALDDYNRGSRLEDAANRYGVPADILYNELKSKGIEPARKHKPESEEAIQKAVEDEGQKLLMSTAFTQNGVMSFARLEKVGGTESNQRQIEKSAEKNLSSSRTRTRSLANVLHAKKIIKARKGVSWTPEIMEKAVEDVKQGMTVLDASRMYQIPCTTIHDRISGRVKQFGSVSRQNNNNVRVSWTAEAMHNALTDIKQGMKVSHASKIYQIPGSTIRDRICGKVRSLKCRPTQSWNKRTLAKAIKDVESGMSVKQASEMHGVPRSSIYKRMQRSPKEPGTEEAIDYAVDYVRQGGSLSSASEIYGIEASTIGIKFKLTYPKGRKRGPKPKIPSFDTNVEIAAKMRNNTSKLKANATKRRAQQILRSAKRFGQARVASTRSNDWKKSRSYKRSPKWSEDDMRKAIVDVKKGLRLVLAAKKYGIPGGSLRSRIARSSRVGLHHSSQENKSSWSKRNESELAQYVDKLNSYGFTPSNSDELLEMVEDYMSVKCLDKSFRDSPINKSWLRAFLERNDSGKKMSGMMTSNQKVESGFYDPFVVYNFYDGLEQISSRKALESNQIWMCCEVAFPNGPQKVKGKPEIGTGHESHKACLVSCSGAGKVLYPFIIHRENVKNSALDSPTVSGSNWATAIVFDNWFNTFCSNIVERPLLVIVDSKLNYISVKTVEKAVSEKILLMKLPGNASCSLQPLRQSCLGKLLSRWKSSLTKWRRNHKNEVMTDVHFTEQLHAIWHKCLLPDTIIAGFLCTGVFPVDRTKFPDEKLDKTLLKQHTVWLAAGKPSHVAPATPSFFNLLSDEPSIELPSRRATRSAKHPVPLNTGGTDFVSGISSNKNVASVSGDVSPALSTANSDLPLCWCRKPPAPIPGKKWVPTWTLLDDDTQFSRD